MNRFRVSRVFLIVCAVIAALCLIGLISVRLYGAHRLAKVSKRYEREVGPLSVQAFVRPKLAAENNAVTWQRAGILATVFLSGDQALVVDLSAKSFRNWTAEDIAKLEAILERNRPAIELLERSRGMNASNWEIPYESGTTAKLPNLLAAINASKMLNARGRLAFDRRDVETAIASVETLGALARSHEGESAEIVVLIGLVIEKLQLGLIHDLATSTSVAPSDVERVARSICDEDLIRSIRRAIRCNVAAIAHDIGAETLRKDLEEATDRRVARALADLVAAVAIEAHEAADADVGRPVKVPLGDADAEDRARGWWESLLSLPAVNLASMSARAVATSSARDLARLAIALRREALAAGHYPAAVPSVGGVPANDPLTGGPWGYEVHADGSAELRSTTTIEIVRSISPGGQLFFDGLYRYTLPAPRGGPLK